MPDGVQIRRASDEGGFTIIELMMVIALLGIFAIIAVPRVNVVIMHQRVNEAAVLVSQDLGRAVSAAATQRRPVRISVGDDQKSYLVTDAIGGDTLWQRTLAEDEFRGTNVSFSESPLDIFPTGFASAPLTVTLQSGNYSRSVSMSTAGWVRNDE
jgi:type IV fimbrial biogenesis protein FimU